MQRVFGAGVHPRALAHGLQPFQDPDRGFGVSRCGGQEVIPNCCGKKPTFYG
ncbi:hypothetical protein ANK1_1709 [plant metagenome]|uniref:Uncharacterized protein n=1 Tax=plant metagenome TaxID=1297885 RepID=A0A484QI82_9ZZZZ